MRQHIEESRAQQLGLEQFLDRLGTSHSALKDMVTGFMGNMAAIAHAVTQDEVLKNSFANFAFEHFEIATYKALLEMSDAAGDGQAPALLRQSLDEELRMAQWIDQHLPETVRTYMRLEKQRANGRRLIPPGALGIAVGQPQNPHPRARRSRASRSNSATPASPPAARRRCPPPPAAPPHRRATCSAPRSILRRWPKAAAVSRSIAREQRGAGSSACGTKPTTADHTLGGGLKAPGGRRSSSVARPRHCASTPSRP